MKTIKKTALYAESWNVAWRTATPGQLLEDRHTVFQVIRNAFRYWAADPFVFEYNKETYIFAELYDYIRCRGIIGYCKLTQNKPCRWKPAIIEDYHLSFPNIIRKGDDIFIMPESSADHSLHIYRATEFPNKWEKCQILRDNVRYVDTVPLLETDKLLTYRITDILNPTLCCLDIGNPEKDCIPDLTCPERRRPAGNTFLFHKKLIRPAQDCVDDYGKGIIFYQYFSEPGRGYQEHEIKTVYPCEIILSRKLFLDGMHTYNCSEHYEVIDIKTRRFNILNLTFRILGKIRRYLGK